MNPSLKERARESLRKVAPEARVNRMWAGIGRRRAPKTQPVRWVFAGIAAAAAMVLAFNLWPEESRTLALEDGSGIPAQMTSNSVHVFSDGSRIEASAEARVDTLSNVEGEVAFALRSGGAHFDIVPNGPRRWRVVAGSVEVVVVGTVFEVERSASAVDVRVERGVVLVRGAEVPDGEQRLEAGESLHVLLESEAVTEPVAETEEAQEPVALDPDVANAVEPSEMADALTLDELLRRADSARRQGRHPQAVRWLSRASREYPEQPRAALAAFTQGRIELESLDRPAAAARSFAQSLRIGLPRPLRETAQALRAESLGQAGDPRAAVEAERFLERYPQSQYRNQVVEATGVSAGESSP